jgi:sarcosine oxidase subunit gamma
MAKAALKAATAIRRYPLDGRNAERPGVSIAPAEPAFRMSLRAPAASVAALSKALGVKLPQQPKTSAQSKSKTRAALWLGPDEWLVIDPGEDPVASCAGVKALHSAVDISHRNTAVIVSGRHAAEALSAGCPQDLSLTAFPAGACSRTVLGKAEIVLWRTEPDTFRIECWRSFSDYVFTLLEDAARDAAA